MASEIVYWNEAVGLDLYWYPNSQSLADWATYRVQAVDSEGVGNYAATLDDSNGAYWSLFIGSSAPASFTEAIVAHTVSEPSATGGSENVFWNDSAGLTLYWFPNQHLLLDWGTYKVLAVDTSGTGNYEASLTDTHGVYWSLFEGSSVPDGFFDALAIHKVSGTSSSTGGSGGAVGTVSYAFTSQAELERLFSSVGIEYRRDDAESSSTQYPAILNEIIDQATWECKAVLNKLFEDSDLYLNPWIRRRATIIGCYLFSIRRGNDAQYYGEYVDALDDLLAVVEGRVYLGIPIGASSRAGMINLSSDNRYPYAPMRADVVSSTITEKLRFIKHYVPFQWL